MAMTAGNSSRLPAGLLRYGADVGAFARERLKWNPDEKQMMVLRTRARRVLLNCSRQWGKTTVAATKVLHVALMRRRRTILVISENMSQTSEFFQKIDEFLERLGIKAKREAGKTLARRLPNGSRIIGLAAREAAVRGYTADFVFIDEAARIKDEVIDALSPVIAVRRGDVWIASTPRGKRGRFWEAWAYGTGEDLLKVSAPASENPRIDPELVERCRQEKGEDYVKREFGCEFVENGVEMMSLEDVDSIVF